jgi:hypothetical protein
VQFRSFFTAGRQNSPLECPDSRFLLLLPWYKTFHVNEQVQSFFQYYIYFLSTTKTKTSPKEKIQAEAAAASRAP